MQTEAKENAASDAASVILLHNRLAQVLNLHNILKKKHSNYINLLKCSSSCFVTFFDIGCRCFEPFSSHNVESASELGMGSGI